MVYAAPAVEGRVALKVIEPAKLTQHIDHVETVRARSGAELAAGAPRRGASACSAVHGERAVLELELLPDGDLLAPIEEQDAGFQEADCARIFAQLAAAVAHLHAHGWAHRENKSENVCPHSATMARSPRSSSTALRRCATRRAHAARPRHAEHVAPEFRAGTFAERRRCRELYGCEADIWSMGVTLHVMLSGRAPWPQRVPQLELIALIRGEDAIRFDAPAWVLASEEARALVQSRFIEARLASQRRRQAIPGRQRRGGRAAADERAAEMEEPALPATDQRSRGRGCSRRSAACARRRGRRRGRATRAGRLVGRRTARRAASAVDALSVKAEDDARAHAEALEQSRAVAQDAIAVARLRCVVECRN